MRAPAPPGSHLSLLPYQPPLLSLSNASAMKRVSLTELFCLTRILTLCGPVNPLAGDPSRSNASSAPPPPPRTIVSARPPPSFFSHPIVSRPGDLSRTDRNSVAQG